jgi:hypothetical protein
VVRAVSIVAIVALIALSGLVRTPPVPRIPLTRPSQPAVALTALTQPLAAPMTLSPLPPQDPLSQQINFHIAFVGDFLGTGAALFAREFAIPGALLQDIQHGTPIPGALGRALVDFAQVELDAGRELVRFAVQYAHFQIGFVANILRNVVTFVMAIPTALSEFVGSLARPTPVTEPSVPTQLSAARSNEAPVAETTATASPRPTNPTASTNDDATTTTGPTTREPKKPKSPAADVDSVASTTVDTKGDVRSVATEPTGSPGPTETDSEVESEPDHGHIAEQPHHGGGATTDATPKGDRADNESPSH